MGLSLSSIAFSFPLPSGTHKFSAIEEAKAAALKDETGIAYVYTNPNLKISWPTCSGTVSVAAIKAARKFSETVLVESKDFKSLPPKVQQGFNKMKSKYIPRVIFTNVSGTKVYGAFTYEKMKAKNFDKLWKGARTKMEDEAKAESAAAEAKAREVSYKTWTSSSGSKITARLQNRNGNNLTLVTREGRAIKLTVNQLDEASQKQLKSE